MWNGERSTLKIKLKIILFGFLLSVIVIVATTPLHEAGHWIMSDIDPYVEPVEFHVFDKTSFQKGENILSSPLGCVMVAESYPGSFNDRPIWADTLQEIICLAIQVIIACIVVTKTLTYIMKKRYPFLLKTQ